MNSSAGLNATSKSAKTVDAIVDATLSIISEGGVDAVSHRGVAARAGVSLSSTTYHFANRDELIARSFERYIERSRSATRGIRRPTSMVELVDSILAHAIWEFSEARPLRAEYELILYSGRNETIRELLRVWQSEDELWIAEGLEGAGIRKPLMCARLLISVLRAFELERVTRDDMGFDELRERLELVAFAIENRMSS